MTPIYRCFQIFASITVLILGVCFLLAGLYMCIILGFFGGIATIVDSVKATPAEPLSMCFGCVKIFFCWVPAVLGVASCWTLILLGNSGLADTRYLK